MGFASGSGSDGRRSRPFRVSPCCRVGSESSSKELASGETRVTLASALEEQNQDLHRIIRHFCLDGKQPVRQGFEPWYPFGVQRFSAAAPSLVATKSRCWYWERPRALRPNASRVGTLNGCGRSRRNFPAHSLCLPH